MNGKRSSAAESMESIQGCPNQQQSVHKKHSFRSAEEKEVRRRRSRTVFTAAQLVELERVFEITHHPSKVIRKILAETINTPETTIQVWFQNRRAKMRWMREAKTGERIAKQKQDDKTDLRIHNSTLLPLTPTSPSPPATPRQNFMFHHSTPNIFTSIRLPSLYRKGVVPHLTGQSLPPHLALRNPVLSASDPCINVNVKDKTDRFHVSLPLSYQRSTSAMTHSVFARPNRKDDERKMLSVANLRMKAEQHKQRLGLPGSI